MRATTEHFDIVIVGARCAGASLGTLLARGGARVLLVDRNPLPSDHILSTHTIHPPGFAVLEELGVGDAVKEATRPSRTIRLRKGDAWADATFHAPHVEICPRRERLDGLLQEAAVEAGCELRDRTRVTKVIFDAERAVGVNVETDGRGCSMTAGLVVGADGRRSLVAEQVGAEEYLGYDAPRAMYWAYWDAPATWRSDLYPFDMYIAHVGPNVRVIFQTDHDQLLLGTLPPVDVAKSWRGNPEAELLNDLARDDFIGPLVGGRRPESTVRGTLKERYFFRRGAGPGWALVGDAGHHKEFVVGDGITEALLQARSLAEAIGEGTDRALVAWWRRRDVRALPGYFWGRDEGALDAPALLETLVVRKVAKSEELQQMMTRLPRHECSPYDVLPPRVVLPILLGAVARGRLRVVPEFLAQVRRVGEFRRALRERERLLEAVA